MQKTNTSSPLNKGGIADLPLLRTPLAIPQKSQEPSFWEVIDSFVLLAYASLAASRTLLQRLLAHLNFTLESEEFFSNDHEDHPNQHENSHKLCNEMGHPVVN